MTSSLEEEEEKKTTANAHVDKESKIGSKTYTPLETEAQFSHQRVRRIGISQSRE
jgi:hypothetical protein